MYNVEYSEKTSIVSSKCLKDISLSKKKVKSSAKIVCRILVLPIFIPLISGFCRTLLANIFRLLVRTGRGLGDRLALCPFEGGRIL